MGSGARLAARSPDRRPLPPLRCRGPPEELACPPHSPYERFTRTREKGDHEMSNDAEPVPGRSPVVRRRKRAVPPGPPPCWPRRSGTRRGGQRGLRGRGPHVLANTCRWGGRAQTVSTPLAQHALTASEEIEALDGIADEDRRALALHALLAPAHAAWLGDGDGTDPASAKGGGTRQNARRLKCRQGGAARPQDWTRSRRKSGPKCCASSPA